MAQIIVNAKPYELVPLDEVSLDEAMIMWDYAHVSLDQIPELEGFHPGIIAGLIHIAIARVELDENTKTIRRVVGQIKVSELEQVFAEISEETETLPPPSVPEESLPKSSFGETSSATGEPAPEPIAANGSGSLSSDTGAASDRVISAP